MGCDTKEEPSAPPKVPLTKTEKPPALPKVPLNPVEQFMKDNAPPEPATLLHTTPKNYSALQSTGCIVLEFDKKPENFKTELPLNFCFADEVESKLGEGALQTLDHLRMFEGTISPFSLLGVSMYISVPDNKFRGSRRLEERFWIFEASWGTEIPQQSVKLTYILGNL